MAEKHHEFPCPTQDDPQRLLTEPLSEKVQRSKCCVPCCIYLMEQIEKAMNSDQEIENLNILWLYLGKSHYRTFKYCKKINLKFASPTTPWKMTLKEKCIWHSNAIIAHMNSINTCIYLSPVMCNAECHDYLYKLLGKKINQVIQNYLVTIKYWAKFMTPYECEKYFN